MNGRIGPIEVFLFLLAQAALSLHCLNSACKSSPLFDEPAHFASGVAISQGDPGYFKVNGPANKLITAILVGWLEFESPPILPSSQFGNEFRPEFELGDAILEYNQDKYMFGLRCARIVRIPILMIGGCILWLLVKHLTAWRRILLVWLWAFSPLVLGHGWVVSADAISGVATCSILLTTPVLWERVKLQDFFLSGLVWGIAIGTKFTFAPLYLMFIPAVEVTRLLGIRGKRLNGPHDLHLNVYLRLRSWCIHALSACFFLNLLYLFDGTGKQIFEHEFHSNLLSRYGVESIQSDSMPSTSQSLISHLHSPFPESFLEGVDQQLADMDSPRGAFLMGRRLNGRLPWFFLVGYCMKEQVAVLVGILSIASGLVFKKLRPTENRCNKTPDHILAKSNVNLSVFCGIFLIAFATLIALNWNLVWNMRYLLPVLPVIYTLLVVHLPPILLWHSKKSGESFSLMGVALMSAMLAECSYVAPHHFSYINPLFGGSCRTPIALNDSNFDYGQDLFYVDSWYKQQVESARNHGDEVKVWGLLSGRGIKWVKDVSPPSLETIQAAVSSRESGVSERAASAKPLQEEAEWLLVSRGLTEPEPWALRYTSYLEADSSKVQLVAEELLRFPPDLWITPVIAGYRIR